MGPIIKNLVVATSLLCLAIASAECSDEIPSGGSTPGTGSGNSTTPEKSEGSTTNCDAIVLGGGNGGSYIAIQLEQKGVNVCVVDKRDHLGGTIDTYTSDVTGKTIETGQNNWYDTPEIVKYFEHLGVEIQPSPYSPALGQPVEVDFETGTMINSSSLEEFQKAMGEYGKIVLALGEEYTYNWLAFPEVPNDFYLSVSEYLVKHNLTAIAGILRSAVLMVNPLEENAFIYMTLAQSYLDYAEPTLNSITTKSLNASEIPDKVAKKLGKNVFLNSQAKSVDRSFKKDDYTVKVVVADNKGRETTLLGKKLVFAYLPTPGRGFDFSAEETDIFSQFDTTKLYNGKFKGSMLPKDTYVVNTNPDDVVGSPKLPNVLSFIPDAKLDPSFDTEHFAVLSDQTLNPADLTQMVIDAEETIKPSLGVDTDDSKLELVDWAEYTISPRVPAQAIKDGFYKRLYGLQGKSNTFYAGNFMGPPMTHQLFRFADRIVLPELLKALGKN